MRIIKTADFEPIVQPVPTTSGVSNRKPTLINQIRKNVDHLTRGMFSDDQWKPVHEIFNGFRNMGLDYRITSANYDTPQMGGMANNKRWKFEIHFTNQKGKPDVIYGQIIASGAGSVENPLEKYDLVLTMS